MNTLFHALDCDGCAYCQPHAVLDDGTRSVTHDRSVVLYGTLTGDLWQPYVAGTLSVKEDLCAIARRFVNADGSGLVDAIRSIVNNAGDFRYARLTPDSYVLIKHERPYRLWDRTIHGYSRYVAVADLPSLADYVSDCEP